MREAHWTPNPLCPGHQARCWRRVQCPPLWAASARCPRRREAPSTRPLCSASAAPGKMLTLGRDGPGRLLSGGLCRQLTQPANPNPGPNPPPAQVLTSPAPIRAAAGPAWTGARGAGAALAPSSSSRMAAETPGRAAEAGPGADLDGHCARARRLRRGGHQMGGSRALGGSGPAFSAPQATGARGPEGDILSRGSSSLLRGHKHSGCLFIPFSRGVQGGDRPRDLRQFLRAGPLALALWR